MNKKELKIYLKTVKFWLKDFEKTSNKYKDYKKELANDMYDAFKHVDFYDIYERYGSRDYYYITLLQNVFDDKSKSNIRSLKTSINNKMRIALGNAIQIEFCDMLNDNEKKNLSIKLYIKFYKKINKVMSEILKDAVLV